MFPISHTGQIELSAAASADIDSLLNGVEQALHKALAINISRNGYKVTFRGGAFRWGIHGGNVLATIGRGEIEVQPGSPGILRYRFFCLEFLTFVLIAATTFGLLTRSLLVFAIAFLWLFGTNYLIGAVRLRRLVRSPAGAGPAIHA
ncbi:MAG TPA: hypothetical protein VD973_05290 [Symbiobacteriaceae bacterium]|jgi:hypothetical protein|nr:hypothetical protein [Symbiobacteriaceae bacterium]